MPLLWQLLWTTNHTYAIKQVSTFQFWIKILVPIFHKVSHNNMAFDMLGNIPCCSFLSCVAVASIALRYRFHSFIMILLMLSCVCPFKLLYHFLAMLASSRNCWQLCHILVLWLVSSHFIIISSENQSDLYI